MVGEALLELIGVGPITLAILALFWVGDDAVSDEFRTDLGRWLRGLRHVNGPATPWVVLVSRQVHRVFGPAPYSWRFFRTSSIYSLAFLLTLFVSMALGGVFGSSPSSARSPFTDVSYILGIALFFVPFNLVLDYMSLLKSRRLLAAMESGRLGVGAGIGLDLAVTSLFTILGVGGGLLALQAYRGAPYLDIVLGIQTYAMPGGMTLFGFHLNVWQAVTVPPALTTFLTVAWTLAAGIGALAFRLAARVGPVLRVLQYVLPVDNQPVRSIGILAALLVALIALVRISVGMAAS